MVNKCPNCGYKYKNDDIFCSKCGTRLSEENNDVDISSMAKNTFIRNESAHFNSGNVKKIFDSTLINAGIFLITLLCIVCFILFTILDKHSDEKEILNFKNLIENPSQIPTLKETYNYKELIQNFNKVEDFLLLYLKNSSDSTEKKNQVFASYLDEIEKLPLILSQKIEDISLCENLSEKACLKNIKNNFKDTSVKPKLHNKTFYLYPNYKYIQNKYKNYLTKDFKNYIDLKAKYNQPISLDLELLIKPTELANKIADFEKIHLSTQNEYIKEKSEEILYDDIRKFLFTPSIYATTTQEMKPEFKKAYKYFINNKKTSNFRPLIMSYMDKKRAYSESNFKSDYPYKMYDQFQFDSNVKKSTLEDVFIQLRKNIFTDKNIDLHLSFVYSATNGKWKKYLPTTTLESGEFILSEPDENNNVSIYNNVFSPMQELNILKYGKLYLIADGLYIYNNDKLSISKITYNGKTFNLYTLNNSDVTSLFPGIEVINIDTLESYNVIIQKENAKANYIFLSRYTQGWRDYELKCSKGSYKNLILPNMFNIDTTQDVIISFQNKDSKNEEFEENKPPYKFKIHTIGYDEPPKIIQEIHTQYDKKTQADEEKSIHKPNMMPKLKNSEETTELENESLLIVPEQKIDPPND